MATPKNTPVPNQETAAPAAATSPPQYSLTDKAGTTLILNPANGTNPQSGGIVYGTFTATFATPAELEAQLAAKAQKKARAEAAMDNFCYLITLFFIIAFLFNLIMYLAGVPGWMKSDNIDG